MRSGMRGNRLQGGRNKPWENDRQNMQLREQCQQSMDMLHMKTIGGSLFDSLKTGRYSSCLTIKMIHRREKRRAKCDQW